MNPFDRLLLCFAISIIVAAVVAYCAYLGGLYAQLFDKIQP